METPQFRHLNIYREARKLVLYGDNALVPYNQQTGFMNMASSFPSSDINSHGVDGTEEDKAKWWENVFRRRAESLITRMHLDQGDSTFRDGKDQWWIQSLEFFSLNVSDHLSSSAFMSLAARFPLKSSCRGHDCRTGKLVNLLKNQQDIEPSLEQCANQSGIFIPGK